MITAAKIIKMQELTANLEALQIKKIKLLRQLEKAVAMKYLWPEATTKGGVSMRWEHDWKGNQFRKKSKATALILTDAVGLQKTFDPADVPPILNTQDLLGVGANFEKLI